MATVNRSIPDSAFTLAADLARQHPVERLLETLADVRAQRDALLAALKEVNAALGDERIADVWPTTPQWYPHVLAAIAKAEGGVR